jgi:nitrate reductase NapA
MEENQGKSVDEMTSRVGMFGSGQWTVWEGYAASKLLKGGMRSNNLDPNARHCMASAVGAFIRAFGIDEPMGCYDDLEHADVFVLWGANMAEMHPILWSRLTDTRLSKPGCEVHVLSTFEHRCFELADNPMIFTPQTDLAILNYIANYIIQTKAYNQDFIDKHVQFETATTDIGYGLRPENPAGAEGRQRRRRQEAAVELRGVRQAGGALHAGVRLRALRRAAREPAAAGQGLCRPEQEGQLVLDHGLQPAHPRRLGQRQLLQRAPADGQDLRARQQPVLADRPALGLRHRARGRHLRPPLPADLVVKKPEHRAFAEQVWKLPDGTIPGKVGYHAVLMHRMMKDGKMNCYWQMCNNNMQAAANLNEESYPGWRNPEVFVTVSDPYPTVSAQAADLVLPTAMWVEKEGAYGNAERRTQFWREQTSAPGQSKSDVWQIMEFAKRFTVEDVWPPELIEADAGVRRQDPVRGALYQRPGRPVPVRRSDHRRRGNAYRNHESADFGYYVQKGLFEEYRRFNSAPDIIKKGHEMAEFQAYHEARGLRWPVIDGKETLWRFREGYDPHVAEFNPRSRRATSTSTATRTAAPTSSSRPTSRPPRARTTSSTSGSAPAACWSTGTPAP